MNQTEKTMHVRKIINELIQLQELVIARDQHQTSKKNPKTKPLEKNIETMLGELSPALRTHFENLLKKDPVAIAPIHKNNCAGCGMALPVSLVNSVHAAHQLFRCPSCTRILYYRDARILGTPVRRPRFAPRPEGIERFSCEALMIPNLKGDTTEEVLKQICERMQEEEFVDDAEALLETALEREAIMSTAVDHGIAFPHVRGVEGGGLSLALGIHKKGIKFNPDGGRLSRIFVFMVIPTAASAFYLKLLSGMSDALMKEDARELLLKAKTQEELWAALRKATRKTIK